MPRPLCLTLAAVIVLAAAASALAVTPHLVLNDNDPYVPCAIGPGDSPSQMGTVISTPITTSDGETGLEGWCGVADTFFFGAGLSQYFAADAAATSIFVGKVGVLRGYGFALAETFPASYGPPFVEATNILSASAIGGAGGFFVDVVTPPPTSTAPNPGDATELILTPVLDVDCAHYANAFMQSSVDVSFWTADSYHDGITTLDPGFIFSTGGRASGDCPTASLPPFQFHVTGLKVGEPVAMQVYLSIGPFVNLFASQNQFGSVAAELSVLNTATGLLTTTDGDPVTGASGHSYVAVAPIPDLMVPTTTTTTLPSPTTTTTLPGCGGACGDGTVDAACGEACDCPPTADPVLAAYGCIGAAVVPAQPSCVVCRGCRLLSFCPSSTTTTTTAPTTTLPGATTTTSTVAGATTTTTVPPAPCAGLVGLSRARCELEAALGAPLCGNAAVPPAVDHALRAKLGAADAALGSALTASAKKAKKLRKRATGDLGAASGRAARAARAKSAAHHVSASCAATIARLAGAVSQDIASP